MDFKTFFEKAYQDVEFKNYFDQLVKNDGKFDDEVNENLIDNKSVKINKKKGNKNENN